MALNLGEIFGRLRYDTGEAKHNVNDFIGTLDKMGEAMEKARNVAAGVTAALTAGLGLAIREADKSAASMRKLEVAIAASGKSINAQAIADMASQLQTLTRYEDEATVQAAAMLVQLGATQSQVTQLVPAITNLSTAMELDLNSAARAVGLSLGGDASMLSRYGVRLDETTKKAFEMASAQGRVNILLEKFSAFAGQAEAAASTAGGRLEQFKNAFGDMQEEIGRVVEGKFTGAVKSATDVVRQLTEQIANASPATRQWASDIAWGATAVAAISTGLFQFATMLPNAIKGLQSLAGATAPFLAITAAVAGLILMLGALKRAWDAGLAEPITQVVGGAIDWLISKFNAFLNAVNAGLAAVIEMAAKAMGALGLSGADKMRDWAATIRQPVDIRQSMGDVKEWAAPLTTSIKDAVIYGLKESAAGLVSFLPDAVKKALAGVQPPPVPSVAGLSPGPGGSQGQESKPKFEQLSGYTFKPPEAEPAAPGFGERLAATTGGAAILGMNASAFGAALGEAAAPGIGGAVSNFLFSIGDKIVAFFGSISKGLGDSVGGAMQGAMTSVAALAGAFSILGAGVLLLIPGFGTLAAIVLAATAGLGAYLGVLYTTIQQSDGWARSQRALASIFDVLAQAVSPLAEVLGRHLFDAVKMLADGFLTVHIAMMTMAANIFGILPGDDAAAARDVALDAAISAAQAQFALRNMSYEAASAVDQLGNAALRAAGALNLPSGYKTEGGAWWAQDQGMRDMQTAEFAGAGTRQDPRGDQGDILRAGLRG